MKKINIIIITILVLIIACLGFSIYKLNKKNNIEVENDYNYSFSELVNKVNNLENYLVKAMISRNPNHAAETLSKIWSDSNLAIVYFENIPFVNEGTNKSIKFLNQLSDYSYGLSKKAIKGQELTDEDFNNMNTLYKYCSTLKDVLNELSSELNSGDISWKELDAQTNSAFAENDVGVFSNIESNFDDYEGLIYDGAYSDYIERPEKLGITGDEIDEETAKNKIEEFFKDDKVQDISSNGEITGTEIDCYSFTLKMENGEETYVDITKKGGWILNVLTNREVNEEKISDEEAINFGKDYLEKKGYSRMKETYYIKKENVITINYAYNQDGVVIYPDLIKVKIALDNGEILGLEAKGYLNNHTERNNLTPEISVEDARKTLNSNIQILSEDLAVIPLESSGEEAFCYEFKGKTDEKEFLVYINAKTGEEEEILVILETEGGVLTI